MKANDWLSGQNWCEQLRDAYRMQTGGQHSMFDFETASMAVMPIAWGDTPQDSTWIRRHAQAVHSRQDVYTSLTR